MTGTSTSRLGGVNATVTVDIKGRRYHFVVRHRRSGQPIWTGRRPAPSRILAGSEVGRSGWEAVA